MPAYLNIPDAAPRQLFLQAKHLGGMRHANPRILVSDGGEWISNGHWLIKTSRLYKPQFVVGETEVKCWAAGRLITKPLHDVQFPTLAGKTVKELFPKGRLFKLERTKLSVQEDKVSYPLFFGPNALPMMIDPVYDKLFEYTEWWGTPDGITDRADGGRQYLAAVSDNPDAQKATVMLMPVRIPDMGLKELGLAIMTQEKA